VLLGDALHSIHPLAGQGLNLSVRDVEYVCNSALNAKRLGLDVGANDFLHQYQKQRYTDNQLMVESTNLLHHLFANNSVFLSEIRANGAKCLDKIPMLKKMTMSYAAGTMVI
jgi:2-octaprenyl-6-methoxyphenol hydroxylase